MRSLQISPVDVLFTGGRYPIEFMIYFQKPIESAAIRSSLNKLSSPFCPVFGHYENGIIRIVRYTEHFFFDEQQVNESFDPTQAVEIIFEQYRNVNAEKTDNLFYLKVLQLNNGSILIPKMSHLAGDGYSYFYFLSVLALTSQKSHLPFRNKFIRYLYRPHHNRNIYKPAEHLTEVKSEIPALNHPLSIEYVKILRSSVQEKLKETSKKFNFRISQNDYLSAMVLKKYIENQEENSLNHIQLTIPIDVRRQIKQYGKKFFGNGLMFAKSDFAKKELRTLSEHDIAAKIRQSMPVANDQSYSRYVEYLKSLIERKETDQLRPYDPEKGCLVTNLSRLPATKLDFGKGRPDFVFPLTIEKNSAVVLADEQNYILRIVS
jgi:hypothetical protein